MICYFFDYINPRKRGAVVLRKFVGDVSWSPEQHKTTVSMQRVGLAPLCVTKCILVDDTTTPPTLLRHDYPITMPPLPGNLPPLLIIKGDIRRTTDLYNLTGGSP